MSQQVGEDKATYTGRDPKAAEMSENGLSGGHDVGPNGTFASTVTIPSVAIPDRSQTPARDIYSEDDWSVSSKKVEEPSALRQFGEGAVIVTISTGVVMYVFDADIRQKVNKGVKRIVKWLFE